MSSLKLKLLINHQKDSLVITSPFSEEEFDNLSSDTLLTLHIGKKRIALANEEYGFGLLQDLNSLIKRAIQGKLELDESIQDNLGHMWHQWYYNKFFGKKRPDFKYQLFSNGSKSWVGMRYYLCCSNNKDNQQWMTFIYSKHGSIFLEVVPQYQWLHDQPPANCSYETYDEFLENYKSLEVVTIDSNNLIMWRQQVLHLLDSYVQNSGFDDRYNVGEADRSDDGEA